MSRTPEEIAHILNDMYEDEEGGDYKPYRLTKAWLREIADTSRLTSPTVQMIRHIMLKDYHLYVSINPFDETIAVFNVHHNSPGVRHLSEMYLRQRLGLNRPRDSYN
jgi:hypothetical protein